MVAVIAWFAGLSVWFYMQSSLWESLFHEYILDITPSHRAQLFRLKAWLPALWNIHFDHNVLHHYQTYRGSYVEQFRSPAEEQALRAILERQLDAATYREILKSRYGATFTGAGHLPYAIPLIVNLAWLWLAPSAGVCVAILLANLIFATPYFVFSKWVHLYMHCHYDDALRQAPWPVRVILRSRYGIAIRISHFVHHKDPGKNFNLQYGADLLRGRWRPPMPDEWDEMVRIALILPAHRAAFEGRRFLLHPF